MSSDNESTPPKHKWLYFDKKDGVICGWSDSYHEDAYVTSYRYDLHRSDDEKQAEIDRLKDEAINYQHIIDVEVKFAVLAEFERDLTAERTRAALAHKRDAGEAYGETPFGYRRDGDRLVEDPEAARAVDLIVGLRDRGWTYRAIAGELEDRGVQTANDKQRQENERLKDENALHSATILSLKCIIAAGTNATPAHNSRK